MLPSAGSMARNMGDLILLDNVVRSSNATSRANGALPAPGVACAAPVDEDFSLQGIKIGLPVDYWEMSELGVDPAVSAPSLPTAALILIVWRANAAASPAGWHCCRRTSRKQMQSNLHACMHAQRSFCMALDHGQIMHTLLQCSGSSSNAWP